MADLESWLADHARPLAVADDDLADDGLDAVEAWVPASAGARVVAVGPAVGGTRELALLACRLIENAVRDGGARTVALQSGESATTVLDDHVRHGTGAAGDALERLGSWSWNTREVLDLVRVLAEVRSVPVVGIDPRPPATAVRVVGAFLRTAAPDALPPVADALADLALGHGGGRDGAASRAAVERVRERLERDVPALVAATSPAQHAEAVRHAGFLARAAELAACPPDRADALAGRLMADAVLDALGSDAPGSDALGSDGRVVLWAHADHIVVRAGSLGAHLREHLGDGYRALVLSAGSGSTRAVRTRRVFGRARTPSVHRFAAPAASSLEGTVLAACPRDALVDLRALGEPGVPDAVTAWAGATTSRRSVGDEVSPGAPVGATVPCVPGTELDAVAVVSTVHPGWVR
ncbi:erythromycin esterase family protein [Actinomycetospora lutea]|uniref:erythromycin esterase family protein n=1 Tax=Actinomycetospora lutea TaxID=663604 RepID=UPI0023655656|nr:erythromycin esterase family protein [Actinomycetospora lutea]MDD7937631.1 erythromycin esterase family protein [Actinomycetospora lutea]